MSSIDETDRKLLAELTTDARISTAKLAEAAGVSRATTYRRLDSLTDRGIIRAYATVLDAQALGLTVTALIMANVDQDDWREAKQAIQQLSSVKYAALVTGDHDLLIIVQATDIASLRDTVLREVNGIPSVRSTRTMLVLDEFVDRINPAVY